MITRAKLGLRVTRVIIRINKKEEEEKNIYIYGRKGHMDKVKFRGHTGYYKDKRDKKAKTPTKSKKLGARGPHENVKFKCDM